MKFEENPNNMGDSVEVEERNKPENEYDREVSDNEVENLQKEIEEKVKTKAMELGISKEKLIDLAALDLESLEVEKPKEGELKEPNLRKGELDFIGSDIGFAIDEFNKENIDEAIIEFEKNKKEGERLGDEGLQDKKPLKASKFDKFLELVRKHKKVVSVGELALYLSSYGMPIINALAENDAKVEIDGEKISLKDLADNPELIKEIDQSRNVNTPVNILQEYFAEPFVHEDFSMKLTVIGDRTDGTDNEETAVIIDYKGRGEMFGKFQESLNALGFENHRKIDLDTFQNNKEKIAETLARDINVSEEEVANYFDEFLEINTSKISVVKFEDFEINKDLEFKKSDLVINYEEIMAKYNFTIPEEKVKAINEFEKWGKDNGYENVWVALDEENLKEYPASLAEKIKGRQVIYYTTALNEMKEITEEDLAKEKEQFENIVVEKLEESGYDISKLKEIGENNPEKIITILAEVIGKNVEYDYDKLKLLEEEKELEAQGPYDTLKDGKGICADYSRLFAAMKYVLEKEGVPNLDKFVVLETTARKEVLYHAWNNLITVDENGKLIVTSIDTTWADDENISKISGKLNAVDEAHCYSNVQYDVQKAHQEALEKIGELNNLAKQGKLREMLMTYDPKLHKRDQKIKGNKELYKTNKDVEVSREEMKKIAEDLEKDERK